MSAREPATTTTPSLLVIVDPTARRLDGESVRIAKDVLSAGAPVKLCLPESPREYARALARRGSRRPVLIGDDRSLVRAVTQLHQERELAEADLAMVPVGSGGALRLARHLGVPASAVAAARAVLDGQPRRLDLLVDDSDGVVLGELHVPAPPRPAGRVSWLRRSPAARTGPTPLRVEADGRLVADLDRPVHSVTLAPGTDGSVRAEVRAAATPDAPSPGGTYAGVVTVSGPDFHYKADGRTLGPVRTRTWRVRGAAWSLVLP